MHTLHIDAQQLKRYRYFLMDNCSGPAIMYEIAYFACKFNEHLRETRNGMLFKTYIIQ